MVVGEFTASTISTDQDRKDAELEGKLGKVDHSKLLDDIERIKASAAGVRLVCYALPVPAFSPKAQCLKPSGTSHSLPGAGCRCKVTEYLLKAAAELW